MKLRVDIALETRLICILLSANRYVFMTKELYVFLAYTGNLFIKAYHGITYEEDLKIT